MAFKMNYKGFPKTEGEDEIRSVSRQVAEKTLDDKLREQGYHSGRNDANAPQYGLTQDTKTGEYIYRPK
jgi:hypothetical protein